MPSQLSSSTSESGGDDRHPVGSRLPMDDNEFAELLRSIQPSALDWGMPYGPREHSKPLSTPNDATLPSKLKNWSAEDCFRDISDSSHMNQTMISATDHCAGELRNDLATIGWNDFENEYSASWNHMDGVEHLSAFIVSDTKDFKDDLNPASSEHSINSWFDRTPLTPTLHSQSPQPPSPISQHRNENQEELDWTDYICIPNDKPVLTENTLTPPTSCQGSPSIPPAPDAQTPTSTDATSPGGSSIATKSIHKTSTQKRQKQHPIATAQLRPKIKHILPNPNTDSATPSHNDQNLKQIKPTSRAKRSSMTDEEGLRKRRNYQRIAEQSRRLRLNSALKDLEALLPSDLYEKNQIPCPASESNETKKEAKKKMPSAEQTKACVMELAVEYIKMLRTNLNEKNVRMQELGAVDTSILL